MNVLLIKKVFCIVTPEMLASLRSQSTRSQLSARVWREIRISATPEKIKVALSNVDEEAATSGYCNAREACRDFELLWPDLGDTDGLEKRLEFEPMIVARGVLEVLQHLKNVSVQAQESLAI